MIINKPNHHYHYNYKYGTDPFLSYPSNLAVEEGSNYKVLLGHSHFDYVEAYLLGSQIRIKKYLSRIIN